MADQADQQSESSTPKLNAPKDKNCPFCGQAFTSSSLGRHLDLYIKEKNPKPSDGIHDVDAIRRLRGGITRRQPRGSLGGRDITPSATPSIASAKQRAVTTSYASGDTEMSPAIPRDGQFHVDTRSKYPFGPRWEATGVINEIPKSPYAPETPMDGPRRPGMQRSVSTVSKHLGNKAQFDAKQRLGEALDTARAAELALRELLSSWRAAKYVDTRSPRANSNVAGNKLIAIPCPLTSTPSPSTFPLLPCNALGLRRHSSPPHNIRHRRPGLCKRLAIANTAHCRHTSGRSSGHGD